LPDGGTLSVAVECLGEDSYLARFAHFAAWGSHPRLAVIRIAGDCIGDAREILAPGEPTRAEAVAAAQIAGAEAVRNAAMSVADDLAGDDDEWAHELMERVACAVAKIRAGGV
jgi:hypothetical protein